MNIVLTGSLGNISKPLATDLVAKGHLVTVVSSKVERQKEIEAIGAKAAIGSVYDTAFLTKTFTGADIVYLMEPGDRNAFFDKNFDIHESIGMIVNCFKRAVGQSGVKKVVHLSSIGAHTNKGVGILAFHHIAENILQELPNDVSIKFMRPVGFYYNMFGFIPTIKAQNAIISNYGGDEKEPWVSPLDIAVVIAEEIEKPFNGREIRYIASDEASPNEVAKILGEAIGKPDLKWLELSDEQFTNGLLAVGMNPQTAKGFTEMNAGRRSGILYQDYNINKPILGKIKLKDFAQDFQVVFNQNE